MGRQGGIYALTCQFGLADVGMCGAREQGVLHLWDGPARRDGKVNAQLHVRSKPGRSTRGGCCGGAAVAE